MTLMISPVTDKIRLPAAYAEAKATLARCARIDECKTWADKAAALASYAYQADDQELMNYAMRIRARAIEREGDILNEIPADPGGRPPKTSGDAPTGLGRMATAHAAGLSRDQAITALRVSRYARENRDDYEAEIEGDYPPTITELAHRGTQIKPRPKPKPLVDLGTRTPEEFAAATSLIGAVEALQRYAETADVSFAIAGLSTRERAELKASADIMMFWLNELLEELDADTGAAVHAH